MKHSILSLLVFFFLIPSLSPAQTVIPDTAELRKQKIAELEAIIKTNDSTENWRQLAMVYAVVAGLDEPSAEMTKKADLVLNKATQNLPKDMELMAAHGSILTMYARFETETSKQLHFLKKGLRKMDRAIKKDPENIGALLQRGNNSLVLPPFLKRAHFARKDFQLILNLVGNSRGPVFRAMVQYNLGNAHALLNETKQAQSNWRAAKDLNVAVWSEKAANKLQ